MAVHRHLATQAQTAAVETQLDLLSSEGVCVMQVFAILFSAATVHLHNAHSQFGIVPLDVTFQKEGTIFGKSFAAHTFFFLCSV